MNFIKKIKEKNKMKIFKHTVTLIWGILIFSVFITSVYAGGFVNLFQRSVGYALTFIIGLFLMACGIIALYEDVRKK